MPDIICQDKDFNDRRVFYKQCVLPDLGSQYLRVIVKYERTVFKNRGLIRTAFASDGTKKGETVIWKKTT